jgi:methionyl-tRNA formyltransferase
MLITILTPKESWFKYFANKLAEKLAENKKNVVNVITSVEDLNKSGDVAFFLSVSSIISTEKLALHANNIVVHASDLPNGRGFAPLTWQILEGKNTIPLTLFEAAPKFDEGVIYLKDSITLDGTELIGRVRSILGEKINEMCVYFIDHYPQILKNLKIQQGKPSFYKRRYPKDSELNVEKTIKEQFDLLRTVDNDAYPAFFYLNNKKYIIKIYESFET